MFDYILCAVFSEDEHEKEKTKEEKRKKKALHSSLVEELRDELSEGPQEIKVSNLR